MAAHGSSVGTAPQIKPQTLIVVQAFKRDQRSGEIVPAIPAREEIDERRAIERAKLLSTQHAGAIAWSRIARPDEGEFGDPIVLFSRGELPDLDMPVRQDELEDEEPETALGQDDGDGDDAGPPQWAGFQLSLPADLVHFHRAFSALYNKHPDRDVMAIFTALSDRRMVILPPAAGALVARELSEHYPLGYFTRPEGHCLSLELGHSLQLDTTWFELSAEHRQARIDAQKLAAGQIEAEDAYLAEFWQMPTPPSKAEQKAEAAPARKPRRGAAKPRARSAPLS